MSWSSRKPSCSSRNADPTAIAGRGSRPSVNRTASYDLRTNGRHGGRRETPRDGLLQGEGGEVVLGVGGRTGLGHHHQHVEPVADEGQTEVDGLAALLNSQVAGRATAQGGIV